MLPRLRPKTLTVALVVLVSFFQLLFFSNYHPASVSSALEYITQPDGAKVFINDKKFIATPFKTLLNKYGDSFTKLDYPEKCSRYFNELYQGDSSWEITDFGDLPYHRYIYESKDKFINGKIQEFFEKEEFKDKQLSEEQKKKITGERNLKSLYEIQWVKAVEDSRKTERVLADAMAHLRVYGSCFLNQFGKMPKSAGRAKSAKSLDEKCHDIEVRAFKWLTKIQPVYTRWNGTSIRGIPSMKEYYTAGDDDSVTSSDAFNNNYHKNDNFGNHCYMKNMRDKLNGKGITVSSADKHVKDLMRLLGSLRAVGNRLPIQVVHSGDLSEKSQQELIRVARGYKNINIDLLDNLDHILIQKGINLPNPETNKKEHRDRLAELLPPQEIWFVNAEGVINSKYKDKFKGYANKLIAYMFNSFQHTIIMDTDTVPAVELDKYILGSSYYLDKGAYFFRDRELMEHNTQSDMEFYKNLMPTKMDTALFGIPEITAHTTENRFIKGKYSHFMESGLVAIDRKRHFTGVLGALQMLLWEPAAGKVWGDKELFWLGMSMAGDEDYYNNFWPSGSVGTITPRKQRLLDDETDERRDKLISNQVCSQHPAHLSPADNKTLLWWNSGFTFCKFPELAYSDYEGSKWARSWASSKEELKEFYMANQKMEAIIVPTSEEFHYESNTGENSRGWEQPSACKGFIWCAYDIVGGRDFEKSNGQMVKFDDDTRKTYDYYASVYKNPKLLFDPPLEGNL